MYVGDSACTSQCLTDSWQQTAIQLRLIYLAKVFIQSDVDFVFEQVLGETGV